MSSTLDPEVMARHGLHHPLDPEVLSSAYMLADVAADDPAPDAVALKYVEFMKAKRAALAEKRTTHRAPAAKAPTWLPTYSAEAGPLANPFTDEDEADPSAANMAEAWAELAKLADAQGLAGKQRATTAAAPKAAPPTPATTLPENLDEHAAPWSLTCPSYPKNRFLAGVGREGIFPVSCLSVLAAPGGMGKTAVAIHLGQCVSAGMQFMGLDTTEGAVVLFSAEDGPEEMARRNGANATSQFPADVRDKIMQRVLVVCIPGDVSSAFTTRYMGGTMAMTTLVTKLIATAKAHAERCGVPVRLIVVDHARLCAGGDLNDSEAASLFTRALSRVASETGAAVVLLNHSPKSSANPNRTDEHGIGDVLGSGALHDNARCVGIMSGLTAAEHKKYGIGANDAKSLWALRIIKSNYSETGRTYYMHKKPVPDWGVVVPAHVDLKPPAPATRASQDEQLDGRVLAYVSERPARFTADKLSKDYSGNDGPLQAGRPAIRDSIARLILAGRLAVREPTATERTASGLNARTKEVLHVPQ